MLDTFVTRNVFGDQTTFVSANKLDESIEVARVCFIHGNGLKNRWFVTVEKKDGRHQFQMGLTWHDLADFEMIGYAISTEEVAA